jgi:hypothetical protein
VSEWEHDHWVRSGWCPAVRVTKGWCCLRAGHTGDHLSYVVHPDHRIERDPWGEDQRMTDSEE